MGKKCSNCNQIKPLNEFHKQKGRSDGRRSHCKVCVKIKKVEYYSENKEMILDKKKSYYQNNSEDIKKKRKRYRKNNLEKVRECTRESYKKYYINNKEKVLKKNNEYYKEKYKTDSFFKLKCDIRTQIKNSFKIKGYIKNSKSEEILGCTFDEFKVYLENRWEGWMNWDNKGLYNGEEGYGWDVDHIVPLSTAKSEKDLLKLNHYTNLQPLCSYKNRVIKRGWYDKDELPSPLYPNLKTKINKVI